MNLYLYHLSRIIIYLMKFFLKYFSSFAAVRIGKKKSAGNQLLNKFFLPIFTAVKDEKYFRNMLIIHFYFTFISPNIYKHCSNFRKWLHQNDQKLHQEFEKYLDGNRYHFCHKAKRWIDFMARKNNFRLDSNWPGRWLFGIYFIFWSRRDIASS